MGPSSADQVAGLESLMCVCVPEMSSEISISPCLYMHKYHKLVSTEYLKCAEHHS